MSAKPETPAQHAGRCARPMPRTTWTTWTALTGGAVALAVLLAVTVVPGLAHTLGSTTSPLPAALGGHASDAAGYVPPGGVSPDDDRPAITGLDPALLAAVRQAAADAARDGVELRITSG